MIRRVLLSRVGGVVGASSLSGLLSGCLSSTGSDDPRDADSDGASESAHSGESADTECSVDSDDAQDGDSDREDESVDDADADADSDPDDTDPLETGELGDLDAVDEPDTLVVRNDGSDDRELDLVINLESGAEADDEDDHDLERTITIPSDECLEIAIGDPDGFTVRIESDGSSTMTSVSHTDSSVSETRIVLTESGSSVETRTVFTS